MAPKMLYHILLIDEKNCLCTTLTLNMHRETWRRRTRCTGNTAPSSASISFPQPRTSPIPAFERALTLLSCLLHLCTIYFAPAGFFSSEIAQPLPASH